MFLLMFSAFMCSRIC